MTLIETLAAEKACAQAVLTTEIMGRSENG